MEINTITQDIEQAQQELRKHKGFGAFSVSTQEMLLYAAAITAGEYAQNAEVLKATLSTSITNIIIAQQVAMIAAISASSAAAASASSSS